MKQLLALYLHTLPRGIIADNYLAECYGELLFTGRNISVPWLKTFTGPKHLLFGCGPE
jgi:hypothetical protein